MLMKLTTVDCEAAILAGEFPASVLNRAPRVALVLTQSWCPQWKWMRNYLEELPPGDAYAVFFVEYDREAFFQPFMAFKEEHFLNREVPYVRYYQEGTLRRESNFIDRSGFLRLLGLG